MIYAILFLIGIFVIIVLYRIFMKVVERAGHNIDTRMAEDWARRVNPNSIKVPADVKTRGRRRVVVRDDAVKEMEANIDLHWLPRLRSAQRRLERAQRKQVSQGLRGNFLGTKIIFGERKVKDAEERISIIRKLAAREKVITTRGMMRTSRVSGERVTGGIGRAGFRPGSPPPIGPKKKPAAKTTNAVKGSSSLIKKILG